MLAVTSGMPGTSKEEDALLARANHHPYDPEHLIVQVSCPTSVHSYRADGWGRGAALPLRNCGWQLQLVLQHFLDAAVMNLQVTPSHIELCRAWAAHSCTPPTSLPMRVLAPYQSPRQTMGC